MKQQKFFPGDKVVFAGEWLYEGEVQDHRGKFDLDAVYEVQDHSQYQDQWDRKATSHVLLSTTGQTIEYGNSLWVDEDCLAAWLPPATDEEVEAAIQSIASSVKS